jgi:hypothetical protein
MRSGFRRAFLTLTGRIKDISANTSAIIPAVFAVVVFGALARTKNLLLNHHNTLCGGDVPKNLVRLDTLNSETNQKYVWDCPRFGWHPDALANVTVESCTVCVKPI